MGEGLVIKSTGSWYHVRDTNGRELACKIKGKFRIKGLRSTNPVAVGDSVEFDLSDDDSGVITNIHQRRNYIIRRASNLSREYQLIACNVDQTLLLISLIQPRTLLGFIDRFLVSAEAFRIPVILVFNKIDLYTDSDIEEMQGLKELYTQIGYQCISVSLKKQLNLDLLDNIFKDKVTVIAGNSGVGKSTLINHLDPSLDLRTTAVSDYHKTGQHTTTNAAMYTLPGGGSIIDTPGIKGFGMVDIQKEELFHFFPEIFRHSKNCKFNNCMHVNEPDCAVIKAVMDKVISESRYFNYLGLMEDMGDKYRK